MATKKKNSKKTAIATARSLAAKKAWITIRANQAAKKAKVAKPKPVTKAVTSPSWQTDYVKANTAKLVPSPKQKLVKGLLKDDNFVADWEKAGQFGISDINKRGIQLPLTKDTLLQTPKANQYSWQQAPAVYVPPAPRAPVVPKVSRVKDLLTTQNRWRKGTLAADAAGRSCNVTSPDACQFCLSGAVDRVYGGYGYARDVALEKLQAAIRKYTLGSNSGVVNFNDSGATTFTDVRRVLEFADI